jgi:hypothetical protein
MLVVKFGRADAERRRRAREQDVTLGGFQMDRDRSFQFVG